MASDTVVLTGGLGMLGSHVTRALVRSGRRPVVYDAGNDTELVSDITAQCDRVQGGVEDMPRFIVCCANTSPAPFCILRRRWVRMSSANRGRPCTPTCWEPSTCWSVRAWRTCPS